MTADAAEVPARDPEARLARIHVRTGLMALARAELETMAGAGALDTPALADLAEVRWRTGDLVGAGEAAFACLDAGGQDPVVLCIAAEAAFAAGRHGDARALVERVLTERAEELDDLFAGQPRCTLWPPARYPSAPRAEPAVADQGLRPVPPDGARPPGSRRGSRRREPGARHEAGGIEHEADERVARNADDDGIATGRVHMPPGAAGRALAGSAAAELADAQARLSGGRLDGLATRLSLVLRAQPVLAPAVLAVADQALATGAPAGEVSALHLVRGDAYRLMGRETSAREAFEQASGALPGGEPGGAG